MEATTEESIISIFHFGRCFSFEMVWVSHFPLLLSLLFCVGVGVVAVAVWMGEGTGVGAFVGAALANTGVGASNGAVVGVEAGSALVESILISVILFFFHYRAWLL